MSATANCFLIAAAIASGENSTGEIDLEGFTALAIQTPSAWTTANLTFTATEVTGGTHQDVYDDAGAEVTVTASASKVIGIGDTVMKKLRALRFVKIRSGTTGSPVNQGGPRTLNLILKK